MADAFVGHMRESVRIAEPDSVDLVERNIPEIGSIPQDIRGFMDENVAPMPVFGKGSKTHVTGSCHDSYGQRNVVDAEALDYFVKKLNNKISKHLLTR